MPYVGVLRSLGIGKEGSTPGVAVAPSIFLPFIPPESVSPSIALLPSKGIHAQAEEPAKITQGAGEAKGLKFKMELEPENCGEILNALFGADSKSGPTSTSAYTHLFERQAVSTLPTYTLWVDKGNSVFAEAPGCMLSKFSIEIKNKDYVMIDVDWEGLSYDISGITHTVSYSAIAPFRWFQSAVKVGGTTTVNFEDLKIEIDNMVKTTHTLKSSIYPSKIWSEGMTTKGSMTAIYEDTTEYAKFLGGTDSSLNIVLTHGDTIPTSSPSTPYSLTIDIPAMDYSSAKLDVPKGIIKVPFAFEVKKPTASSYGISMSLVNGVSTAYSA